MNNDRYVVGAVGESSDGSAPAGGADKPQDKYFRADAALCNATAGLDEVELFHVAGACPDGALDVTISAAGCEPGAVELADLWVQRVQADGSYAEPEMVSAADCVTPADVAAEARRAFEALQIDPPVASVQGREPLLVNVHYPARAETGPLEESVTLLGVPVTIRAEPVEFTWDFDDPHSAGGGTLTTTDPGRAWRDGDATPDDSWVGHRYTSLGDPAQDAGTDVDAEGDRYRDDVTVTLTTTWQGSFSLAGSATWTPIAGAVTTTTTLDPVTVTEARVRLVCDDVENSSTC
ncbi:hypothetical protein [Isoptericola jiangsuensis]|uniref:hypothetical protein n=1 Tax=Isoptericola jiangsuensis TaxID=548579 RepID=UPI0011452D20|nr:hypothetical protein [Isoptericola jiangsuensis]